jgi:ferredoxin
MNCVDPCPDQTLGFHRHPSAAGQIGRPDLTRRQVVISAIGGVSLIALPRLGGSLANGWDARLVRPPGALAEADLLARCVKCGQCMRICPTNVIQPAGWENGLEKLWTPVLDFRVGTSGCQHNCVACSQICPTAALRPLSVAERMGAAPFEQAGPIRIGTAFVDRGRCLPWAMDKPCIVCQENCPVSPKAIFTRAVWQPVRDGDHRVRAVDGLQVTVAQAAWRAGHWAGGDFGCRVGERPPVAIVANGADALTLAGSPPEPILPGEALQIVVYLQQPHVDPSRCIGCGVCEHECPVQGLRAIRVTAENESRHRHHRLLV